MPAVPDKKKKATPPKRQRIKAGRIRNVGQLDPLAGVGSLRGVRVYDVGQGDGLAVIDGNGKPVLHIDYGGRQRNPFMQTPPAQRAARVDAYMPIDASRLVMVTHWDEDHWCSADKGIAARAATWLVPRQVTSPRAVEFAAKKVARMACIPEAWVGVPSYFRAANGDELWWEKIAASGTNAAAHEDCNHTGVAFSLVRRSKSGGQVILLPGDAPFGEVGHYRSHWEDMLTLTGIVAFHHGADTHWTSATRDLLEFWPLTGKQVRVVFSCGVDNSYGHPFPDNYAQLFGGAFLPQRTDDLRRKGAGTYLDLDFA